MDDPIVEEIHQTRQRIFAECNGELDRLIARLQAAESKDRDRLVGIQDVEEHARPRRPAIQAEH